MSTETALPPVDDDEPPVDTHRREPGWVRPFVVAAAVLVLLLVGATAGLLVARSDTSTLPVPAADSVDVGFAQDMTVHHQQAVQMAAWERDHTTDPDLHQLAYDIESTQTAQVGRMQGWLELWGAAGQPVGRPYMTWMAPDASHGMVMGSDGVATMPGMATAEDLRNLRAATGKQLDVLFLQLMLRHHEGGRSMLADAAQHASQPQVRNLAAQMLSSQSSEADYMKQLLAQRGAAPLPL
ncbi:MULTISPECIES: DUF305 domain-containing protein [unclassified Pseudonocardia]|uniref:DUF305 domain-containing protein n=1 Tax=unclassified Pseudonocardia TaxID=2619320 RepID=UPI00095DC0CD|nr:MULTISPECIES: DUF305 domain-containing protein [unclassified Pseudonocardia]MBN9097351.1 DUF305 domain-containing protein [Pseudonocardia sp.]OJY48909.1 MAG: DUF305 domain-containing protein [Pseudonocardia sp. 73-21]